ncbi:TetR-like C-terminal domain-containing protein [Neobacillus mesonae]|uniref:TetR-like C-terminal domain-containing protein n=1 Tax=Neobacillus mesonae TaxID=1193713 RepID=UPI002889D94A|nr:TetR-like C-terminal domain-containing protein [Neobacillus mesonae]
MQVDFRYKMAKAIEQLFIQEYEYVLQDESSLDTKWLYVYRAHGIAGVIIRWIEEAFPESPEYMSRQILELMLTAAKVFYVKDI